MYIICSIRNHPFSFLWNIWGIFNVIFALNSKEVSRAHALAIQVTTGSSVDGFYCSDESWRVQAFCLQPRSPQGRFPEHGSCEDPGLQHSSFTPEVERRFQCIFLGGWERISSRTTGKPFFYTTLTQIGTILESITGNRDSLNLICLNN